MKPSVHHSQLHRALVICTALVTACVKSPELPPHAASEPEQRVPLLPEDDGPRTLPDAGLEPLPASEPGSTIDAGMRPQEATEEEFDLYSQESLLRIRLTLASDAWEKIRHEGRSLADVYTGCSFSRPFEYSSVPAEIEVDGHAFHQVGVRKKGFIGSLATINPSLRVDLAEHDSTQKLSDEKIITLNNSLSDNALVRQCLAYHVFGKAGLPAPRCNFAAVTVNGDALGTYVHVEAIKKPMLRRALNDDSGDLYEGVMGDFRPDRLRFLEKKTHEDQPLSPEIVALSSALTKADDQMLAELANLIDLDAFIRYWATEGLLNHEDGYSGNQNNFFVYVHSTTRKLHFIPWGTDSVLKADSDVMVGRPATVYATSRLARRLWAIPRIQEQYRGTLRDLLQDVWNESELFDWLDAKTRLLAGAADADGLAKLRTFIAERRALLSAELDAPGKPWPFPERGEITCDPAGRIPVEGSFVTSWETSADFPSLAPGDTVQLTLPDHPLSTLLVLSSAGHAEDGRLAVTNLLSQVDGSMFVLQLLTTRETLEVGRLSFHGFETFGVLLHGPAADQLKILGFVSDGAIQLDKMQMKAGEPVAGSFRGVFTYKSRIWSPM